jgi:hypothetical protein
MLRLSKLKQESNIKARPRKIGIFDVERINLIHGEIYFKKL